MERGQGKRRRRNFFTKQWLQFRWMLVLAGATTVGGVAYAFILRHLLTERLKALMFSNHRNVMDIWQDLYPVVLQWTVGLLVAGMVLLLLFLQFFAWRVSRAAREMERGFAAAAAGGKQEDIPVQGKRTLADFRILRGKMLLFIAFYHQRGAGRAAAARESTAAAATLAGETDPALRLAALERFDRVSAPLAAASPPLVPPPAPVPGKMR
jgi:hypothetical protein